MPAIPNLDDEVTFISNVRANGTLALECYYAWNDGTNPADYSGGYTNAMKWGGVTAGTSGGTVYYYFDPDSTWDSTEQLWLSAGLAMWSAVANISFALTTDANAAQITFKRNKKADASTAPEITGGEDAGITDGTVLLTLTGATISIATGFNGFGPIDGSFTQKGGYPTLTYLHEEGHAIGLGHAGPYNGDVEVGTQQFSPYDTELWSLMSYIEPGDAAAHYYSDYPVKHTNWGFSDRYSNVPTTWMPLDILAAQRLYGLPITTPLSGGQTFGFNCTIAGPIESFFDFTKNTRPIITLWNMGANNTLDLSGFTTADSVNLNAGTFSSIDGLVNNIAIAFNTAINTLVCGSGNTTVTCNNFGDTVYGGSGNDTITGGNGNDTISGGGGKNILYGGGGFNTVSYANSNYNVTVDLALTTPQLMALGGYDTLSNFQAVIGSRGSDTLAATGMANAHLSGGAGNDIFNITNAPGAVLDGGIHDDTFNLLNDPGASIDGGEGNDTLNLDESALTSNVTLTLHGASATPAVLPDGTSYKNIEYLHLKTGSGNDTVTFDHAGSTTSWDGGGGDDTAIIDDSENMDYLYTLGVTLTNVEHFRLMVGDGGSSIGTTLNGCTIIGGASTDTFMNQGNNNTFFGGDGYDTVFNWGSNATIDGGTGFNRLFLYLDSVTAPLSFTFTPGSSTAVTLPDGTNFKNIQLLSLSSGSGADHITFNNPVDPAYYPSSYWDGGAGNDIATVSLTDDTGGITAAYSGSTYTVTRDIAGAPKTVLRLDNIETFDITGGSGDDTFSGGAGNDVLNGGEGSDTAVYSDDTAGVTVNLAAGTATGSASGTDTLISIENVTGSAYNDTLSGDAGNNVLTGLSGDDVLRGGLGTNVLDGGLGTDRAGYGLRPGNYYVTSNPDGSTTVRGPGGLSDTLRDIEQASFDGSGQTLTLGQFATASFDPLRYIASNSDLIVAFGANTAAAVDHYMGTGYGEGRDPTKFDALRYVASNTSLIATIGTNTQAATLDYIQRGYGLGLSATSFDAMQYLASNTDLMLTFGADTQMAEWHYIVAGYGEGRSSTNFDPLRYVASNPGLIATIGTNTEAASLDYVSRGFGLGLSATSFDPLQYIASYAGLIAAFGTDTTAAEQHYITNGYGEGRNPTLFDPLRYVASNPGLIASIGTNRQAAELDYITSGYAAGRSATSFDPLQYIASYAGLIAAFGTDTTAAEQHYITNGYGEGRNPTLFDPLRYVASNPGLIASIGANTQAASLDYVSRGYGLGLSATSFDALRYLASNTDLLLTFGTDTQTAELHYIVAGYGEGRSTTSFDPLLYAASYVDLAKAYGMNATAIETQYITQGYAQGRTATFDPVAYLISNPDLGAAGFTAANVVEHYLNTGVWESRSTGAFGTEQTTHALSLGSAKTDTLGTAGDQDWFGVTLTAGQSYELTLSGADGGQGTLADPFLKLYDAHGQLVAQNNDNGSNHDSLIAFTATASGTYYLTASGTGTGSYSVLAKTSGGTAAEVAVPTTGNDYGRAAGLTVAYASSAASTLGDALRNNGMAIVAIDDLLPGLGNTTAGAGISSGLNLPDPFQGLLTSLLESHSDLGNTRNGLARLTTAQAGTLQLPGTSNATATYGVMIAPG